MDIEVSVLRDDGGRRLIFEVEGIDLATANGLRRAMLADVQVPAVRFSPTSSDNPDVHFVVNTSGLHNEILGQRLSLIPVHFNAAQVDTFHRDDYKFSVHVSNTGKEARDVTTDDVKVLSARGVVQPAALHHQLFPRDAITGDGVIITRLKPGEELHVETWATMGSAREYGAGFCPVSVSAFGAVVDEGLAVEELAKREAALRASHEERSLPPPSDQALADMRADFAALDRQRCFRRDRWGEPTRVAFRVESTCGLSCQEIALRALNVLSVRAGAIAGGAQDARVRRAENGGFSITVPDADHTDGNLLQSHMYDVHVEGDGKLTYVGYHVPHPLEGCVNLRVVFAADATEEAALEVLRAGAEAVGERLRQVRAAFERGFAAAPKVA